MAVYQIEAERFTRWHLYALVMECGEKQFVVKVGVSSDPVQRYESMLTALPFKSTMLTAPVGGRRTAFALEARLHRVFRERNTNGEWFRFSLDEKALFHSAVKKWYFARLGEDLDWTTVTPPHVRALMRERQRQRDPKSREKRELQQFRIGT